MSETFRPMPTEDKEALEKTKGRIPRFLEKLGIKQPTVEEEEKKLDETAAKGLEEFEKKEK